MDYSILIIVSAVAILVLIFAYTELQTAREEKYKQREWERSEELRRWLNYLKLESPVLYEKVVGKRETLH